MIRTIGRYVGSLLAVLLFASAALPDLTASVVQHATPSLSPAFAWLTANTHALGGVSVAMFGPLLGLKGKTYEQIAADAQPKSPEYYPAVWFDSQTFTSASTVGNLNFFQQPNTDQSLSNMQLAGTFPQGEAFDLGEVHFDILERTTAETAGAADSAAVGAMDDLQQLMWSSRATISLIYRNKTYGPVPLGCVRPLGFVRGSVAGAFAAATSTQFAGWDAVGWIFEKQLTITPQTKFGIVVNYPATVTLSQASCVIRVALRGEHYRGVQ